MRIAPNQPRLRMVALVCWSLGIWWLFQPSMLTLSGHSPVLPAIGLILATLLLAVGVTFWLLAHDRSSGITFDRKGLSLNLGHSVAFIAWDNIAAMGVTGRRSSIFALGSKAQLGIRLHSPEQYLQSYELRLPASAGPVAHGVRLVERLTRSPQKPREPGLETLEALRRRTGYDLVIPEAQLGARAEAFVGLLETYRSSPEQRRSLPTGLVISRG